jgi:hypothetical protein
LFAILASFAVTGLEFFPCVAADSLPERASRAIKVGNIAP